MNLTGKAYKVQLGMVGLAPQQTAAGGIAVWPRTASRAPLTISEVDDLVVLAQGETRIGDLWVILDKAGKPSLASTRDFASTTGLYPSYTAWGRPADEILMRPSPPSPEERAFIHPALAKLGLSHGFDLGEAEALSRSRLADPSMENRSLLPEKQSLGGGDGLATWAAYPRGESGEPDQLVWSQGRLNRFDTPESLRSFVQVKAGLGEMAALRTLAMPFQIAQLVVRVHNPTDRAVVLAIEPEGALRIPLDNYAGPDLGVEVLGIPAREAVPQWPKEIQGPRYTVTSAKPVLDATFPPRRVHRIPARTTVYGVVWSALESAAVGENAVRGEDLAQAKDLVVGAGKIVALP